MDMGTITTAYTSIKSAKESTGRIHPGTISLAQILDGGGFNPEN